MKFNKKNILANWQIWTEEVVKPATVIYRNEHER